MQLQPTANPRKPKPESAAGNFSICDASEKAQRCTKASSTSAKQSGIEIRKFLLDHSEKMQGLRFQE